MILDVKNLTTIYHKETELTAINNVSFQISEGERMGIIGESGSGKTTLALSMLNLIMPYEGKIVSGEVIFNCDGEVIDILKQPQRYLTTIRGRKITMVFQDPNSTLNPVMTIREQMSEIIKYHKLDKNIQDVIDVFRSLQLQDPERILKSYPHQLSGGQKQRVAIGAAILPEPKVIIADEPTTALDTITQKEIISLFESLHEKYSLTTIFITHNPYLMKDFTERLIIMYEGEIVEEGKTVEIFDNPLHPYTKLLFSSIPKPVNRGKLFDISQEQLVEYKIEPRICKFYLRCNLRTKRCESEVPTYSFISGRRVKCLLYG